MTARRARSFDSGASEAPLACFCCEMFMRLLPRSTSMEEEQQTLPAAERVSDLLSKGGAKSLLEKYELGKILGQGAFGVVYACTARRSSEELAVKFIDRVEMPLDHIEREVEMLGKLVHPQVVRLHDVYYEDLFVCTVLDLWKGGDVITAIMSLWEEEGKVEYPTLQSLSKMMVQSIAWLHQNDVVHRDVKYDNFLLSSSEIDHPDCRLCLSDFGTVLAVKPGQRLSERCGTDCYWSPEFWNLNYGLAVDMWAIGVVVYGLATTCFPFDDEHEVKHKTLEYPQTVTPDTQAFIRSAFCRAESERLTARQALEHPFLTEIKAAAETERPESPKSSQKTDAKAIKETGANAGVQDRRRELIERIAAAQDHTETWKGIATTYAQIQGGFNTTSKLAKRKLDFEWWTAQQAADAKFVDLSQAQAVADVNAIFFCAEASVRRLRNKLEDHGVDTSQFGHGQAEGKPGHLSLNLSQAKTISDLSTEVQCGESRLLLDATKYKSLVRVVDLVLIRVCHGTGSRKRYLVKLAEKHDDGRERTNLHDLPGTKKPPHECARQTALRVLRDRLGMREGDFSFDWSQAERFEEEEVSHSYPALRTVYRKEIYEAILTTTDRETLAKIDVESEGVGPSHSFSTTSPGKCTRTYEWVSESQCQAMGVVLRAPANNDFDAGLDKLIHAPTGCSQKNVQALLQTSGVDMARFGKDGTKTLQEFSDELIRGDSQLTQKPDGSILRVVDVVVLQISREDGDVIVEAAEHLATGIKVLGKLPATKRRPDENPFLTAKRVLYHGLKISENLVDMDRTKALLVESEALSDNYAGMPTMYRRLIIPARIREH